MNALPLFHPAIRRAPAAFVFLGLALTAAAAPAETRNIPGTLTRVEGDVSVSTGTRAPAREGEIGWRAEPGAVLRTGADGRAEILFDDGTALRLEANTLLRVQEATRVGRFRQFLVQLVDGRLLSNIPKWNRGSRARFKVRTPVAVAAVRGTVFVTDASTAAATVAVYDGNVQAGSAGGPAADLGPNQQTDVALSGGVPVVRGLSADMADYRDSVAELFAAHMDELRSDMDAVREMNETYMESHRNEIENSMNDTRDNLQDLMEGISK